MLCERLPRRLQHGSCFHPRSRVPQRVSYRLDRQCDVSVLMIPGGLGVRCIGRCAPPRERPCRRRQTLKHCIGGLQPSITYHAGGRLLSSGEWMELFPRNSRRIRPRGTPRGQYDSRCERGACAFESIVFLIAQSHASLPPDQQTFPAPSASWDGKSMGFEGRVWVYETPPSPPLSCPASAPRAQGTQ